MFKKRKVKVEEPVKQPEFNTFHYFPSAVYSSKKPEFIASVSEVSDELLSKIGHDVHDIYPMHQTESFAGDSRVQDFCSYVGHNAWGILQSQGYAMDNFNVTLDAMWTQKHHKHSFMERHVHGGGHQLVGFYFLETPEGCSRAMFHDPRCGKVQINLPEQDMSIATPASNAINFVPEPGLMLITNAWLPHSFGRHGSDKPIKFVHFNLSVGYNPAKACSTPVEVV